MKVLTLFSLCFLFSIISAYPPPIIIINGANGNGGGGGISGVSQIIAGGNVLISPAGGTGAVTITAIAGTGAGGNSYNGIYDTNSIVWSKFFSTIGTSNDIRFNSATNTFTDLPPYNSAYWTGTNYNSMYITSTSTYNTLYDTNSISWSKFYSSIGTSNDIRFNSVTNTFTDLPPYNSVYDAKLSSTYNSIYDTNSIVWSKFLSTIGTANAIRFNAATNTFTNLPPYNSVYDAGTTGYNSIYDTNSIIWSKFASTLTTANDIRFNTVTNTITNLPPYNGAYWTGTNYNGIYDTNSIVWSKFFSTLATSNDIKFNTATNTITNLPPYNSAYMTSTYNSIYDTNSIVWSKFASTLGASNDIRFNSVTNIITDLPPYNSAYWTGSNYNSLYAVLGSPAYFTSLVANGITGNYFTSSNVFGYVTANNFNFNTITQQTASGNVISNTISTNIIAFQTINTVPLNGLQYWAPSGSSVGTGNSVANLDSSFWMVYPVVNSLSATIGTFAEVYNSQPTGIANQYAFTIPVVGASNSVGEIMIPFGMNVMFTWSASVNLVAANIIKLQ
jgi:hypothetical protein